MVDHRPRAYAFEALTTVLVFAAICAGCAAPFQKPATKPPPLAGQPAAAIVTNTTGRPSVGVAFGGGSARGIAHVGVIRWLEEHRIPIDMAAGTSMGGLIGGAVASGMDAAETATVIARVDWDQVFRASSFAYKNIPPQAHAPHHSAP